MNPFKKKSADKKMVGSTMNQLMKQGTAVKKAYKAGSITSEQKATKMKSLNSRVNSLNKSPSNQRTIKGQSGFPNRGR